MVSIKALKREKLCVSSENNMAYDARHKEATVALKGLAKPEGMRIRVPGATEKTEDGRVLTV